MKENTFEELIKDFSIYKIWWANAPSPQKIDKNFEVELINFGKQVREATIAECKDLIWDEYGLYRKAYETEAEFDKIKTDRIKTEKSPPKTY